jgi:hypothetical protein
MENICGTGPTPPIISPVLTPSIAWTRAYSASMSGVSTPIALPPGPHSPIGGLSARRVVEPGGATSTQRLPASSPNGTSARSSQPSVSV